ncbi:MAG TPA: HlyD family type I secretion periplasmic adaptor subunit, partial [Ramlibacter sp.]|nr:HlyD family type I secretion periplasmic adaptor subunit [Ramlibacter sp.]
RSALLGQTALLRDQNDKVLLEGRALAEQIRRAAESMALQSEDLANNRKLLAEGYISPSRLTQLEAQVADYAVKLEERRSEHARAEQRLLDSQLRIRALENDYRQQASDQLKVTHARLAEIQQEQRKTGDAARRQVITAPAAGEVMGLRVTAPGAVIPPRETIAEIVPRQQKLVIEAMVRPEDIDHVRQGQAARIRFGAFAHRTTKLVDGTVTYVSADRLVDREAGSAYYLAHIEAAPAALAEQPHVRLVAGMPAEVFIEGAERTPLQYLLEPLVQSLARAARER